MQGKRQRSTLTPEKYLVARRLASFCLEESSDACAGPAGSDIGCLMTPNPTNVQRITPNISNLHFHANSEHTRDGTVLGPPHARTAVTALRGELLGHSVTRY